MTGRLNSPKSYFLIAFSFLTLLICLSFPAKSSSPNLGVVLTINGPIGPATSDYIHNGFQKAQDQKAKVVIIEMDTPGGLDTSMRAIIRNMLSSFIPVIVYVTPEGARAASAGAYILYASQLAAMAPGTNVGAATPIQLATPISPNMPKVKEKKGPPGEDEKIMNDSVAFIQSLAEIQGRNKVMAEKFVREAKSIPAKTALSDGVIEVMANNLNDLLMQANGRTVVVQGKRIPLDTHNLTLEEVKPNWRIQFLETITNPNIAYILLLIGIYGLILEFFNPGGVAPGVIGIICLLLGLYALHVLPVNYTGLALIVIGIAFIIAEAYYPSFGALGIGGIVAFIVGSILLFDTKAPGFEIYWPLVFIMAAIGGIFMLIIANMAFRSHHRPSIIGKITLVHKEGRVLVWRKSEGMIKIQGENWRAHSDEDIRPGDIVIVEEVEGLNLKVRKKK